MMELRKGEREFNIENISLELRRPRTFSQIKILEIHENIEDFHPCDLELEQRKSLCLAKSPNSLCFL